MSIALRKLNTSSGMMFNSCMAYNIVETQIAVNMAEQALQQRQIPFDIIFDQQLDHLEKYDVVVTDNTGIYDGWRRLREEKLHEEMLSETEPARERDNTFAFNYGQV